MIIALPKPMPKVLWITQNKELFKMETEKKAESVFYKIGFTVLISIVGFFCMQYALKLNEIQK